jgi:hypothetical protein
MRLHGYLLRNPIAISLGLLGFLWLFSAKGYVQTTDTLYSLETARSLIERGSLVIPPMREERPLPGGGTYSPYGIGVPVLMIPGVALPRLLGVSSSRVEEFLLGFYNLPWALLLGLSWAGIVLRMGLGRERAALGLLLLFLGTMAWRYAVHDFSEMPQAALLAATVFFLARSGPPNPLAAGSCFAGLILVKLVHAAFWPVLLAALIAGLPAERRLRDLAKFHAPVAAAALLLAVLNHFRYGAFWMTGYGRVQDDFSMGRIPENLYLLSLSPEMGLLAFNPLVLATLPAWPRFLSSHRLLGWTTLGLFAVAFAINLAWSCPDGGWAWGPRLLMPVLPLLLLPLAGIAWERPAIRRATLALFCLSVVPQVIGLVQRDHEYRYIRHEMVEPEHAATMPGILPGTAMLAREKLAGRINLYPRETFGLDPGPALDTRGFASYAGWDFWHAHLARHTGIGALHGLLPAWSFLVLLALGCTVVLAEAAGMRPSEDRHGPA